MSPTSLRRLGAALALVAIAGLSACATTTNCPTGPADASLYDLNILGGAFRADGATFELVSDSLAAVRFEDIGVVIVVMPLPDRDVIRMSSTWTKDPNVLPTAEWLLKVNEQNKDGIVKVYLDDDADVITEWYLEAKSGLTPGQVSQAGRVFAARSQQVARELSGYLQ